MPAHRQPRWRSGGVFFFGFYVAIPRAQVLWGALLRHTQPRDALDIFLEVSTTWCKAAKEPAATWLPSSFFRNTLDHVSFPGAGNLQLVRVARWIKHFSRWNSIEAAGEVADAVLQQSMKRAVHVQNKALSMYVQVKQEAGRRITDPPMNLFESKLALIVCNQHLCFGCQHLEKEEMHTDLTDAERSELKNHALILILASVYFETCPGEMQALSALLKSRFCKDCALACAFKTVAIEDQKLFSFAAHVVRHVSTCWGRSCEICRTFCLTPWKLGYCLFEVMGLSCEVMIEHTIGDESGFLSVMLDLLRLWESALSDPTCTMSLNEREATHFWLILEAYVARLETLQAKNLVPFNSRPLIKRIRQVLDLYSRE